MNAPNSMTLPPECDSADSTIESWQILPTDALKPAGLRFPANVKVFVSPDESSAKIWNSSTGDFWGLAGVETRILLALCHLDPTAAAVELSKHFDASRDTLREDIAAFIQHGSKIGVLEYADTDTGKGPNRCLVAILRMAVAGSKLLPVRLRVAFLLSYAGALFRFFAFETGLAAFRLPLETDTESTRSPDHEALAEIDQLVTSATSASFTMAQCKERSIVFWRLASERGIPAAMVIGVDFFPFSAHAWAESGGSIYTDETESVNRYLPISQFQN